VLDLKVNSPAGDYDVVGLTNWRGEKAVQQLDLVDKLGLDSGARYLVMDFWNQKLLDTVQNQLQVEVEPHDTRVLLIRRLLDRPQVVGTSRHITGSYSVSKLSWTGGHLAGEVETVPGEPYALWVHLPRGKAPSHIRVTTKDGVDVKADRHTAGELLTLSFAGQKQPVAWELSF